MLATQLKEKIEKHIAEHGDTPIRIRLVTGLDAGAIKEPLDEMHYDEENHVLLLVAS